MIPLSPMNTSLSGCLGIALTGCLVAACASGPAAPFDTMKNSQVTVLRLQNYEPPPPAPGLTPGPGGMIPGLPPEITQWAQQALPGLQQLIPPGLLPPGMLGGAAPTAAAPPPDAPRFPMSQPNFRILGQQPIMDPELKEELAEVLGDEDNFDAQHSNCMYAEMGISFQSGGPPNDLLISFSCNQVEARSFAWPHPYRGMKPSTVKQLAELVQQIFPGG